MTKAEFYKHKRVARVEWWLHDPDLPDGLAWARLRVFNDGTADSCFGDGTTLHGFLNADNADYILSEDEFVRLGDLLEDASEEVAARLHGASPPVWRDTPEQPFEYRGTYP